MSILKNVEILCKKYVDDHPDSLRDAKRRCFAHLLKKKKKKRSENDTSDKLLAIQIEMRTRGEAEKADELESLLGRIDHTAVLEMLLLLRMKKRNDDRILVSSENKKLRKFFREPSEATYSSPKRHSQLSSFFSPSSESKKRTNLFGALNVSKLVPRSKPVRSLNLKLSIPVLVSVRDANVVKRAERKSERHRKYKNNDGKERKKKKSKKSKKKESKSETSDCKENIWTIATNKHYEKKKYWEDDITPSESHSILVSSASQFSTFHRKEFQSMFESQSKVVKLREIILDSYKCLQGIPSTTFTYVFLEKFFRSTLNHIQTTDTTIPRDNSKSTRHCVCPQLQRQVFSRFSHRSVCPVHMYVRCGVSYDISRLPLQVDSLHRHLLWVYVIISKHIEVKCLDWNMLTRRLQEVLSRFDSIRRILNES